MGASLKQQEGETVPIPEPTKRYALIGNKYQVTDRLWDLPRTGDFPYRPLSNVEFITLHHTVTDPNISTKALADYHMQPHGTEDAYPAIAYTFVIGPDGETELCNPLDQACYAVYGRNQACLSICLKGDFTYNPPPAAQIAATKRLCAELQFTLGWFAPVRGHREVALAASPTACPGDTFLPQWKAKVVTVAPTMPAPVEPPKFQFVLGFKALADKLGAAVVGTPTDNEHRESLVVQHTSTGGLMTWVEGEPAKYYQEVK
jgi:hypothetical protein